MTHHEYQEQISQLIDGELEGSSQPALFSHLGTCAECRGFFQKSLQLRYLLSAERAETIPVGLNERMHQAPSQTKHRMQFWRQRLAIPIPIAATILLALALGGIVVTNKLTAKPQPEVVYVPTLPTIEVQGYYFKAGN